MSNKKQIRRFKRLKATGNSTFSALFLNDVASPSSAKNKHSPVSFKNTAKALAAVEKRLQAFTLLGRYY